MDLDDPTFARLEDQISWYDAKSRESQRRLRTMAEALPLMVWTAEQDGATD